MDASSPGSAALARAPRHAPVVIALHWLTALLVVALWAMGQTVDIAPEGPWRVDYRSLHVAMGAALAVVLATRVAWRATRGGVLPPLDHGFRRVAAIAVHWTLYVLLVVAIGLGIANAWVRGDSLFNLIVIPSFAPDNRALRRAIGGYHALAANWVLILAGLHALAALVHHYVLNDATLYRMRPWSSR
jgi:cytochrome b561